MRNLHFILFCLLTINSFAQITLPEISEKVQVVDFGKYKGYIYPKEYGEYRFTNPKDKKDWFDADSVLIQKADSELINQYYSAIRYFMEQRFIEIDEYEKKYSNKYNTKVLKKQRKEYWRKFSRNRAKFEEYLEYSDRQYIGYCSDKGEKIIQIYIIPQHYNYSEKRMKQGFAPIVLSQEGGNVEIVYYNIGTNKITLNEDF